MIEKDNIKHINAMGETFSANCWGSTQFALGVIAKPVWQNEDTMTNFLRCNTKKIKEAEKMGDILVMKGNYGLVHTAVYIGPGDNWWHKAGSRAAEYCTHINILDIYSCSYNKIEYRRLCNPRMKRKPTIDKKQEQNFVMRMYRMFLKLSGLDG